jgi:Domain of unknown function (DUF4287)
VGRVEKKAGSSPDHRKGDAVSFQAYLDSIEAKTGKTPNEFVAMAKEKGYDAPETKAGTIVDWLKQDFGLGRGHAMALVHVIKNGAQISDKHVGSSGVHRDESDTLRLDGSGS